MKPVLKQYDSGIITAAAASESFNTDIIKGEIARVEILTSAATDFKIYCDASDAGSPSIVDRYIVGSTGTAVTVNTTFNQVPVEPMYLAAGTITDPDNYVRHEVSEALQVDVTSLTAADTYRVVIWYKEYQ